jgi:hypothetical protein
MITESKLGEALRRKYRTPADALRALGLDESLLEKIMPKPKLTYDEIVRQADGSYLPRQLVGYGAMDAQPRRRARDDETDPGDPDDDDDGVEELLAQLAGVAEDWRRKRASDRKKARDDFGPPFSDPAKASRETSSPAGTAAPWNAAEDRRRSRRHAHDSNSLITDRDFNSRFPETSRISMVS